MGMLFSTSPFHILRAASSECVSGALLEWYVYDCMHASGGQKHPKPTLAETYALCVHVYLTGLVANAHYQRASALLVQDAPIIRVCNSATILCLRNFDNSE